LFAGAKTEPKTDQDGGIISQAIVKAMSRQKSQLKAKSRTAKKSLNQQTMHSKSIKSIGTRD